MQTSESKPTNNQQSSNSYSQSLQFQSRPVQATAPPAYSYPKAPDLIETKLSSDDQSAFARKHSGFFPAGDLNGNLGNNFGSSVYRPPWNPYYQANEGFNRVNNYGNEIEYSNGFNNRDSLYWNPNARQYDIADQLLQQRQLIPINGQGDDWSQNDNLLERTMKTDNFINGDPTKLSGLQAISQESASDLAKMKTFTQNQNKIIQQSEASKNTPKLYNSKPLYSNIAGNKAFTNTANIVAVSYMHDSIQQGGRETNSAVIALTLGLCITALLVVLVGCRMKSIKRRIARRGRTLAHDSDYLVNGMYL